MRAFSYIRFSSKEQAKGHSLERQLEATRAYCERSGLVLDETLHLHDLGVSGWHGNNLERGTLGGFVKMIEAGKIPGSSVLIVENIDRLTRDQVGNALTLFINILSFGVRIVTLKPEREYTRESINDIGNLLVPLIDFSRAYEESQRKSDLVGSAWRKKKERARTEGHKMTARCPYWLRLSEDRKEYLAIPERVEVVRRIFEMAAEGDGDGNGKGMMRIAATLNAEGVPPFGPNQPWNIYYVGLILKSRSVLGEYQPHRYKRKRDKTPDGQPIPNYFPAVIDEELYHRVQSIVRGRNKWTNRGRKEKHTVNVLRGMAYDAKTGSALHLIYVRKPTKAEPDRKVFKLVPNKAFSQGTSIAGGFRYDHLEAAFLRFCREELKEADFLTTGDVGGELTSLAGRLVEIDDKIRQVKGRIDRASGGIDVFLDVLDGLQSQKKQIEARMEEVRSLSFNASVETFVQLTEASARLAVEPKDHEAREAIRVQVRLLVDRIWLYTFDKDGGRHALCQVNFRQGFRRYFVTGYSLDARPYKGLPFPFGSDRLTDFPFDLATIKDEDEMQEALGWLQQVTLN